MRTHGQHRNHTRRNSIQDPRRTHQIHRWGTALLYALALILLSTGLAGRAGNLAHASDDISAGTSLGKLVASPASLKFGSVSTGANSTRDVTLTNGSRTTATISKAEIHGSAFTLVGSAPASIAPGGSATLKIRFTPSTSRTEIGELTVTTDISPTPLSIKLVGSGWGGSLSISPSDVIFSNVQVGQTSTRAVSLANVGSAPLTLASITANGTGFGVSGIAAGVTIDAGSSRMFSVNFTPAEAGTYIGMIVIQDTASAIPRAIPLVGTAISGSGGGGGAAQGTLTASPSALSFGNVNVGSTGKATITLTNSGSATMTVSQAITTGPGFTVTGISTPLVLAAGQTSTFTAQFAPTAAGSATGNIAFTNSNASDAAMNLVMTGSGVTMGITASPASVAFGNVPMGSSASRTVTLENTGSAALSVATVTASGPGFSVTGVSPGISVAAGSTATFNVDFAPTTAGSATGSVTVVSNASSSALVIPLSADAVQASISASPASVSFGDVSVGGSGSTSVTLSNGGSESLTVSSVSASGTGFSISGMSSGVTVAAGSSATFNALFKPTAAGSVSGSVSIVSTAANSPLTIPLSGTGVEAGISVSPASIAFGSVTTGSSSSQAVTLSDTGTSSLSVTSVTVSGTGFSISGSSSGISVGAGSSSSFKVVFAPSSAGSHSGTVTIVSNAPNSPISMSVTGTGVQATEPTISTSPTSVSFGSVTTGSSSSESVMVMNTGTASLSIASISASGSGFSVSGMPTPTTIAAGGNTTFNVVFAPTSAGSATGTVSISSNAAASTTAIPVSGTGMAATQTLSASPASLSFGSVNNGTTSSLTVTLTNSGNSNVTISGISTSGGAGFMTSGVSSGLVLEPSQTATLTVAFDPAAAGAVTGTVNISSNATNSPTSIAVSGTGVAAATSVGLSWTASASSNVAGYNVYRGTTEGTYSKLTSSTVSGMTYTDSTVQSGQDITYYYVVTAVGTDGTESSYSSPTSVTVP